MLNFGWFLYILGALFIIIFWYKSRGLTFEELLKRSENEHERVKRVFAGYPHGGTWKEIKHWMKEVE